ncbi:glycosyltransferase family 9 protein [Massilia sp. METH4]|uniref:glycosyltransferase family 9 protein n=1 Tax=Massilia sp. METH4 TaxID=3123041 RepID=UPI0030D23A0F
MARREPCWHWPASYRWANRGRRSRWPAVASNNSRPAHISAALGTPVVDLYALTNPQHTPWQVPNRVLFHDVPCRNCYSSVCREGHHACLAQVKPEQVVAALLELLDEADVAPAGLPSAARPVAAAPPRTP